MKVLEFRKLVKNNKSINYQSTWKEIFSDFLEEVESVEKKSDVENKPKIDIPNDNEFLLELGKNIMKDLLDKYEYEDTNFRYIELEYLKDETLISIAKNLYQFPDALESFLIKMHQDENFKLDDVYYDFINNIVFDNILADDRYYFDNAYETILIKTPVEDIVDKNDLAFRVNELKDGSILSILLDEDSIHFLNIKRVYNDYCKLTNHHYLSDEIYEKEYRITDFKQFRNLLNYAYDLISCSKK